MINTSNMHNCCHFYNLTPKMESAICLRYCPFPYGYSKGFEGTRPSRFHLRLNHATPLCVPQFSTSRRSPDTRSFSHANCMLERFSDPSENEASGNKILRGVTGASLVLACVVGLFSFSAKMNPKFATAYAQSYPFSNTNQGRVVIESLLRIKTDAAKLSSNWKQISSKFGDKEPDKASIVNLKLFAISQSESLEGRNALNMLKKQYGLSYTNNWEEAYRNLGVALIEVYIVQGNFEEARKTLNEQIDKLLKENDKESTQKKSRDLLNLYNDYDTSAMDKDFIVHLMLYKAIVHTMLEPRVKEAVEWRKAFSKID